MFERVAAFFKKDAPEPAPLPEPDAQLALGVLLVRMAMADKSYVFEEVAQIDRVLAEANGLNPIEAAKMRATSEKLAHDITDDEDMAARIREAVTYEQRLDKVEALWRVALADGVTDQREARLLAYVVKWMGISERDAAEARARACA